MGVSYCFVCFLLLKIKPFSQKEVYKESLPQLCSKKKGEEKEEEEVEEEKKKEI